MLQDHDDFHGRWPHLVSIRSDGNKLVLTHQTCGLPLDVSMWRDGYVEKERHKWWFQLKCRRCVGKKRWHRWRKVYIDPRRTLALGRGETPLLDDSDHVLRVNGLVWDKLRKTMIFLDQYGKRQGSVRLTNVRGQRTLRSWSSWDIVRAYIAEIRFKQIALYWHEVSQRQRVGAQLRMAIEASEAD